MVQVVPVASLPISVHLLLYSELKKRSKRLSSLGLSFLVCHVPQPSEHLSGPLDSTQTPDTALSVVEGGKGSLSWTAGYPPASLPGLNWVLCWLTFSLLSTRTPRSFSMEMLPRQLLWACTVALDYSIPHAWLALRVEEDPVLSIPSTCPDSSG